MSLSSVQIQPGAGPAIGTLDVGGVKVQVMVLVDPDGNPVGIANAPLLVDVGSSTVTALPGSSGAVAAGAEKLWGCTIRETSGTGTALVRLRDGVVGGAILATISLDPGESLREPWAKPAPVANAAGVYVEIASGAVEGSVFTS